MKRILFSFCFVAFAATLHCQKPITPVRVLPGKIVQASAVTLYENANYSGSIKALQAGKFSLTDFNDMASSIKVASGYVAMLFDNANTMGGYGISVDLMEDCPDLSIYNFNDKVSYVEVFSSKRADGFIWARGKTVNGQYIAGHWERERANGQSPNGTMAVVSPPIPPRLDPNDFANAPLATQSEIDEFNNIINNQNGVGVLGGDNTRPFYYHANKPNESVYKYQKLIDASKLPSSFMDWAKGKLSGIPLIGGGLSTVAAAGQELLDNVENLADAVVDNLPFIGSGSKTTETWIDCWYPVSENKITVCGKAENKSFICSQDYLHTQLTIDKDVNLEIIPGNSFLWALNNRWLKADEQKNVIEGEVRVKNLSNYDTKRNRSIETTTPHNPLLLQIQKDANVCVYGPWMADILDIHPTVSIPFTDDKLDLGKLDINTNDEIHPVNQIWFKKGDETDLIAIADGNGYFEKTGNREIEASGLNHAMRFYIAFQFPAKVSYAGSVINGSKVYAEYDINGVGFDFTDHPVENIQPESLSLKYNGVVRIKVNDNSFIKLQKTHIVFFEKVRTRPDGSVQGYIVVETVPIVKKGGSINIIVNHKPQQTGGINPAGNMQ